MSFNSNRLSLSTPTGTVNGTYDDQDRLLSYGGLTYTYAANGKPQSKTVGWQVTDIRSGVEIGKYPENRII